MGSGLLTLSSASPSPLPPELAVGAGTSGTAHSSEAGGAVATAEGESSEEGAVEFWVAESIRFRLSSDWSSEATTVQLNDAAPRATHPTGDTPTRSRGSSLIAEDQKVLVDAAIVRALKSHEELPYAELLAEIGVVLAPRFRPDVAVVRASIDRLIEGEYIARHEQKRDVFVYLP